MIMIYYLPAFFEILRVTPSPPEKERQPRGIISQTLF
jgi:hypothetical protein